MTTNIQRLSYRPSDLYCFCSVVGCPEQRFHLVLMADVKIVCVFVVIFVSASASKPSCCFQADAFKQVIESLSNCPIESVQLSDLVPGKPGVGRERFQQTGRQRCIDFFKKL